MKGFAKSTFNWVAIPGNTAETVPDCAGSKTPVHHRATAMVWGSSPSNSSRSWQ